MKQIISIFALFVLTMSLLGVMIYAGKDDHIMVPPPESVAEQFTRFIVTQRFSRALPLLSENLAQNISAAELKELAEALTEQLGQGVEVKSGTAQIQGDEAEAGVSIKTRQQKEIHMKFQFVREKGLWSIRELSNLTNHIVNTTGGEHEDEHT